MTGGAFCFEDVSMNPSSIFPYPREVTGVSNVILVCLKALGRGLFPYPPEVTGGSNVAFTNNASGPSCVSVPSQR